MFQYYYDLEDQDQGHQVSKPSDVINTWLKFEHKIPDHSQVVAFMRNHTDGNNDDTDNDDNTKTICLPSWGLGETKMVKW